MVWISDERIKVNLLWVSKSHDVISFFTTPSCCKIFHSKSFLVDSFVECQLKLNEKVKRLSSTYSFSASPSEIRRSPYFVISLKCHILNSYNFSFLSEEIGDLVFVVRTSLFSPARHLLTAFTYSLGVCITIFSLFFGCLRMHDG